MNKKTIPYVTIIITAICIIVQMILAHSSSEFDIHALGMYKGAIQNMEVYRVFTSEFVHADFSHIFWNMSVLLLLGIPLERVIGSKNFLIVYLCGILGSSIFLNFFAKVGEIYIGANGAICAVITALMVSEIVRGEIELDLIIGTIIELICSFVFPDIYWQGYFVGGLIGLIAMIIIYKYDKMCSSQKRFSHTIQIGDTKVKVYDISLKL